MQIIIDKNGVVQSFGDGSAAYTCKDCETLDVQISEEEKRKVNEGQIAKFKEGFLLFEETEQSLKRKQEKSERELLKERAKSGTLTSEEIQQIIYKLL